MNCFYTIKPTRGEKMRLHHILIALTFPLLIGGCAVGQAIKNNVQGTHYLQTRNYREGESAFRKAVTVDPDNPQPNYYLGRFLLAEDKPKQALPFLQKAASLAPSDTDYLFWNGVALGETGRKKRERQVYTKILQLKKDHLQALIYLGHNLLAAKKYEQALEIYARVLKIWPSSPSALYNRALIAKILKRSSEERAGWLAYLSVYPSGALAIRAADHLNLLKDFSYRNHSLGARTITLTKIWFAPFTDTLLPGAKPSLDVVGATALNMSQGKLQIIVFVHNDKKLARARAVALKKYLLEKFPALARNGIGISWFGCRDTITIQGKRVKNPESVRFFLSDLQPRVIRDRKKKRVRIK
jgi:tetratricopeptide (TPR) repeat protein